LIAAKDINDNCINKTVTFADEVDFS